MSDFATTQKRIWFENIFSVYGPSVFWHDSSGLALKQEYSPSDWWHLSILRSEV